MQAGGAGSTVSSGGGLDVQCAPIEDILARYTDNLQKHIDLWVLDVEGHELQVLQGTNFSATRVDVMLIEDVWLPKFPTMLDMTMDRNNFIKFSQLVIDAVYVRRDSTFVRPPSPVWYPPQWEDDVQANIRWAKGPASKAQLKKSWGLESAAGDHLRVEN
jgi:hypothetical protein